MVLYNIYMGRKKKEQTNFVDSQGKQTEFDEGQLIKEYDDILNLQRKQYDHLLGDFINGEYTIKNDEIRQKLILITKIYENTEGNVAYESIKLNQFVLNFKIEFLIEPTYCDAKLYLIEIEHGTDGNIKHTTLLDSIVMPYSPTFREEVFKAWNVIYEGEDYQIDDFLFRYMLLLDKDFMFNREIYAILGQLYVIRMLSLLSTLGTEGQKVDYEFKMLMEKILKENPGAANDYILQKRILDNLIKKHNLMGVILASENGRKIVEGYVNPIKNIEEKKKPTIIETSSPKKQEEKKVEKKEEKKEEKPAAKKKKSSAKKSGGKPAKKEEKKKDDEGGKKKKGGGGGPIVKKKEATKPAVSNNGASEKQFQGGQSNQKRNPEKTEREKEDELFDTIIEKAAIAKEFNQEETQQQDREAAVMKEFNQEETQQQDRETGGTNKVNNSAQQEQKEGKENSTEIQPSTDENVEKMDETQAGGLEKGEEKPNQAEQPVTEEVNSPTQNNEENVLGKAKSTENVENKEMIHW